MNLRLFSHHQKGKHVGCPPFVTRKIFGGDHRLILELLNGIKMIQGRRYTLQVSVSNPPMELIQNQPWLPGWTMPRFFAPPSPRSLTKGKICREDPSPNIGYTGNV